MKKKENYLLFVLSLLREGAPTITYAADGGTWECQGVQTNEAVTKYLADYLHKQGMRLNKIILLCSEEVRSIRLDSVGGRTTLEYYEDVIWSFLEKYQQDYEDRDGIFKVIPLEPEKNQDVQDIVRPMKEILEVTEENEPGMAQHLYIDFTGGMRNAALLMIFACRILQRIGVYVDKILYSNIGARVVEECTRTYQYFEYFECLIKEESNPDKLERYDELISRLPQKEQEIIRKLVEDLKIVQQKKDDNKFSDMIKATEKAIGNLGKIKNQMEESGASKEMAGVVGMLGGEYQTIQKYADNGRYPELPIIEDDLKKEKYDHALNLYRESIVNVLYNGQIIQVKQFLKDRNDKEGKRINVSAVTQEIIGAYCYYEHPDDREYSHKTMMDAVQDALERLGQAPEKSPRVVLEQMMGDSFYNVSWYLKNGEVPQNEFRHNDFSRKPCDDAILPYLKEDYGKGDIIGFIDKYKKLDKIYMCHGFPFAATYDRWFLKGYDSVCRRVFKNGIRCLQDFYDGKSNRTVERMLRCFPEETFTYETLIPVLHEERYGKMLRILFPFQLDNKKIYSEILNGEEWYDFIYEFSRSFCFIKNVRNRKIHKNDLEAGDVKEAVRRMEASLALIRKYIR